ncbi:MAG: response regulator [Elusimicrobiales bacterium]|nr:response regulator [Elusimicrobiales bacterium]
MPPRKKVLVIDDDKTIHAILKMAFEKAGYQVFAALDAMQGMMMAKQVRPELIVLDIMMPAGGGFAVYDRLQMMSGSFQVPFLIYSSVPGSEIMAKIQEGPTVKILSKTAKLEEVIAAANELTGA